jgi:hypothetical protein
MRTTNFDTIAAAAPLDRQASVIRDGSGDLWEAKIGEHVPHWSAPPLPECAKPEAAEDLEGRPIGRMVVVRYHGGGRVNGSRWLCRCACGDYELRSSKAIKRNANPEHGCAKCDKLTYLLGLDRHRRNTGKARKASEALLDQIAAKTRAA